MASVTRFRLPSTQSRFLSADSFAIGTTDTVLDPLPSAFGPTVSSTMRPEVFSNGANRLAGGLRSLPLTASRYSPAFTSTPGSVSGDRSSGFQLSPPYTFLNR